MLTSLIQLGWREIVADIPLDAGTIVVFVILFLFVGVIWFGSVKNKPSNPPGEPGLESKKSGGDEPREKG